MAKYHMEYRTINSLYEINKCDGITICIKNSFKVTKISKKLIINHKSIELQLNVHTLTTAVLGIL